MTRAALLMEDMFIQILSLNAIYSIIPENDMFGLELPIFLANFKTLKLFYIRYHMCNLASMYVLRVLNNGHLYSVNRKNHNSNKNPKLFLTFTFDPHLHMSTIHPVFI